MTKRIIAEPLKSTNTGKEMAPKYIYIYTILNETGGEKNFILPDAMTTSVEQKDKLGRPGWLAA